MGKRSKNAAETPLRAARRESGLTMDAICTELGVHNNNYYRIERGTQTPGRELARRIHEFFGGRGIDITLGQIYDPEYEATIAPGA